MNDSRFEKMIIERLKEKNWTQAELAEALNVEYKNRNPTMNFYIHGKRQIPREVFMKLGETLAPSNNFTAIEEYTKTLASAYMEFLEKDPNRPTIPKYLHELVGGYSAFLGIRKTEPKNPITQIAKAFGVVAGTVAMGTMAVVPASAVVFGTAAGIYGFTKKIFNGKKKEDEMEQNTINDDATYKGPFGLKMGLTLEEIKSVCSVVENIETGVYKIIPKIAQHSAFSSYEIAVDQEYGLFSINAKSESMKMQLCSERFNSLKEKLEKGYGTSRSFNAEDIEDGVTWNVQSGNQKFVANNLNNIFLTISKTQDDNAQISILYDFTNINDLATRAEDEWL